MYMIIMAGKSVFVANVWNPGFNFIQYIMEENCVKQINAIFQNKCIRNLMNMQIYFFILITIVLDLVNNDMFSSWK
jgi:hypothetical protein